MILTLSIKETVVSKNHNRLHMGKERGTRNNFNVLDVKCRRMAAMETTETCGEEGDGLSP